MSVSGFPLFLNYKLYISSNSERVNSLLASPVFKVVLGSNNMMETSFSATGRCSTPLGTIKTLLD